MRPIIIHHLNSLTMGGTEKMVQIMMKDFKNDPTFNHVLAYQSQQDRSREQYFREILGENKLIPYASYPEFIAIVKKLKPYIIHRYSAGIPEFPFIPAVKENTKHFISTSVFGNQDDTIDIEKVIFVSKHVQHLAGRFGAKYMVIRNAIEKPYSDKDLRFNFNIPDDVTVFGHIGRPDENTFENINLQAYKEIENNKTMFLWLPQSELVDKAIKELKIKNIIVLPRTTNENELSKFYNTIDVLAHSRKDGECNPAVMWEAFAHGKPVISHYGLPFNGHIEVVKNAGFVVPPMDIKEYIRIMQEFIDGNMKKDSASYRTLCNNAENNWKTTCYAPDISKQQLDIYKGLL